MISGSYPCCGGDLWIGMPEKTPTFAPDVCPHCGARVWHVFSRMEPMTYTEAGFLEKYVVDDETKTITPKEGNTEWR